VAVWRVGFNNRKIKDEPDDLELIKFESLNEQKGDGASCTDTKARDAKDDHSTKENADIKGN
jgi:hypothetical protein